MEAKYMNIYAAVAEVLLEDTLLMEAGQPADAETDMSEFDHQRCRVGLMRVFWLRGQINEVSDWFGRNDGNLSCRKS